MNKFIFFDCETTGKAKDFKAPYTAVNNWPRITQLAWAIYDEKEECRLAQSYFIKPDGWVIEKEAEELTGITLAICEEHGNPIRDVLETFSSDAINGTHYVAHNVDFDQNVIGCEYHRLSIPLPWTRVVDISNAIHTQQQKPELFCTMKKSTNLCKLPGKKPGTYKWPKLAELHKFLFFNEDFSGAHAALNDVQATAKCYFELQRRLSHISDYVTAGVRQLVPGTDYVRINKNWLLTRVSQYGLYTGALLFTTKNDGVELQREWIPKSQLRVDADGNLYISRWILSQRNKGE